MPLMGSVVDWTWLIKKISELEDISIKTSKTEKRKMTGKELKTRISKTLGKLQKV